MEKPQPIKKGAVLARLAQVGDGHIGNFEIACTLSVPFEHEQLVRVRGALVVLRQHGQHSVWHGHLHARNVETGCDRDGMERFGVAAEVSPGFWVVKAGVE